MTSTDEAYAVVTGRGFGAPATRRKVVAAIALLVVACYAALAVAVHLRLLDALDLAVRDAARPDGIWGSLQIRADRVVNDARPPHVALALLLAVTAVSVLRRSLRPWAAAALVGLPVAVVTLGTKWIMAHSEGQALPVAHGSFPSGHTVIVVIAAGIVVLVTRPGTPWAWLLPAVAGLIMGSALILASVHPATDVIAGGLLASAAMTGAAALGVGRWARGPAQTKCDAGALAGRPPGGSRRVGGEGDR